MKSDFNVQWTEQELVALHGHFVICLRRCADAKLPPMTLANMLFTVSLGLPVEMAMLHWTAAVQAQRANAEVDHHAV